MWVWGVGVLGCWGFGFGVLGSGFTGLWLRIQTIGLRVSGMTLGLTYMSQLTRQTLNLKKKTPNPKSQDRDRISDVYIFLHVRD